MIMNGFANDAFDDCADEFKAGFGIFVLEEGELPNGIDAGGGKTRNGDEKVAGDGNEGDGLEAVIEGGNHDGVGQVGAVMFSAAISQKKDGGVLVGDVEVGGK